MSDLALFDDLTIPAPFGGTTSLEFAKAINSTFGDDSPRARRTDPAESHRAADSNNTRDSRALVLTAFHQRLNFADHELVEFLASSGYTPQRIRTARHDLTVDGLLELVGTTVSPTGRSARVFTLRKDAA